MQLIAWTQAARHGRPLPGALPQRGILGRREEAQRGAADGAARARRRRARRDRLRPRHRRAAPGRGRHRGGPQGPRRSSASCSITHYQRILDHLVPDVVHVLIDGRIVATGGPELAETVEAEGFDAFRRARWRDAMTALDVAAIKRDFPILEREVNGKRLVVPRLRVVVAEAARGARRDGRLLPALLRQHPPRRVHDRRGGDRRVRGRPRARSRASSTRAGTAEIVFTRNATEAINLVAYTWARANLRAGDAIVLSHMEHHANVVPWHMLAAERGVELRWIPLTDDFRLDLTEPRPAARRRQAARDHRDVERARHDQRHPPARRRRARARRARARRRVPVRAARRHRRAGVGRRLRRVLRAQDVRPERHRRAVGPPRAARGDAAVPRRRRDDPRRPARRLHHQRRAVEVRSGHAADRRGRSASAPPSTT